MSTGTADQGAVLSTAAAPPGGGARLAGARRRESLAAWLFSAPGIILLTAFLVVPFGMALVSSFTNLRLLSPLKTRWIGFENYTELFSDEVFRRAVLNNAVFVLIVVPVQTALALLLAVLVNQRLRGMIVFRTIYFAPVVTVMAATATVWSLLYQPDDGLINGVLKVVTFGTVHPDWLDSSSTALLSVIILSMWQGVGFQMVIILAGLQAIPRSLYEAADVDGASSWQIFRHITVPQLRNTLLFVATITTILAFRLFDQVWAIPTLRGGPLDSTQTMMVQAVQQGWATGAIGRSSAIAVVFFLIVLTITLLSRLVIREDREVK